MTLADELDALLCERVPPRAMLDHTCTMEDIRLERASRDLGNDQYRLCLMRYTIQLTWLRFPYRVFAPDVVIAMVAAWSDNRVSEVMNALGLEAELPEVDVVVIDEETAEMVITLEVAQPMDLTQDATGLIELGGRRYRLDSPLLFVAEHADLHATTEGNTWLSSQVV